MKKTIALGILALAAAVVSEQQASAWVNWKFGIGANMNWQSGGNNVLWGLFRNGQPPGPDCCAGGQGGHMVPYGVPAMPPGPGPGHMPMPAPIPHPGPIPGPASHCPGNLPIPNALPGPYSPDQFQYFGQYPNYGGSNVAQGRFNYHYYPVSYYYPAQFPMNRY